MIKYYGNIFRTFKSDIDKVVFNSSASNEYISAYNVLTKLNSYGTKYRIGDVYIRQLFNAILLLYIDKFGFEQIDKAVRKFFCFAYGIRLEKYAVTLAAIDNAAVASELIQKIRDANDPYEVINLPYYKIENEADNADEEIKELYYKIIG